ncbi:MAG: hypothetical protein Q9223_004248 [Gallowayella weberi]
MLAGVDESDITWNYVPAATWSAAEPSISVVSACLPSLRPLFVRLVWGGTHAPNSKPLSRRTRSLPSWSRSKSAGTSGTQGSFNRLQELESDGSRSAWRQNSVAVVGGKMGKDLEEEEGGEDVPWNRIRAKTHVVVSISERVDWQDDLF